MTASPFKVFYMDFSETGRNTPCVKLKEVLAQVKELRIGIINITRTTPIRDLIYVSDLNKLIDSVFGVDKK